MVLVKKGIQQLIAEAEQRSTGISLEALTDMGMQNVLHMQGGFGEWKKAGSPVAPRPHKPKG